MWFKKRDLYKTSKQIYSIGEKKNNFRRSGTSADIKNLYKYKKKYSDGDSTYGQVFMVKDAIFNDKSEMYKGWQVVSLGIDKGFMSVVPIYKNKYVVKLSNFDNCRSINLNNLRSISLDNVYEKEDFPNTSNSYLTDKEIIEIRRKMSGDYHY